MNRVSVVPEMTDQALLDLLVDGELDAARRSALFSQLDATPGGWRQCALAFLEAQAWRMDLRAAGHPRGRQNPRIDGTVATQRSLLHSWRTWSSVALTLACVFFAGWLSRPIPDRSLTAGPVPQAARDLDSTPIATAPANEDRTGQIAKDAEQPAGVRFAGVLTLKFDDQGRERELQLPVLEGPGIDVRQWLEQPLAVRASDVQALKRRGHQVEAHRQLLTVNLKDGRKLLLPVDQVDVRFAHRVYQ